MTTNQVKVWLLTVALMCPGYSLAGSVLCEEKVLDTNTIEGVYLGYDEEDDFNMVGIKVDSGEEAYIACTAEQAKKFFDNAKGKDVSLTYELRQYYLEDSGCMRLEVCTNGKILKKQ